MMVLALRRKHEPEKRVPVQSSPEKKSMPRWLASLLSLLPQLSGTLAIVVRTRRAGIRRVVRACIVVVDVIVR